MSMDVIDELQLSSLKTSQELLMRKQETIHQLDTQIRVVTSTTSATADIKSSTTVTAHTTTPTTSLHLYSTSRLPKLELPTFSRDPFSWQSF